DAAPRRVDEPLTASSKTVPNERREQKQIRVERADREYPRAAAELSQMVLGPVAAELGKKRLLVVSDGALQYVPFAALPTPKDEGGEQGDLHPSSLIPYPLVVDHEIVSLPSASVLAALRQEASNRRPATKAVAVLADPVCS